MKKKIGLLLLLFVCLVIVCSGVINPQSGDLQIVIDPISQVSIDNFLVGKSYKVSRLTTDKGISQTVWAPRSRVKGHDTYGTYITFVDATHYQKGNTAPCGNDCFFSERGQYHLLPDGKLALTLDSISYHGMCQDRPTVYGDGKEVLMNVTVSADSIVYLTPIEEITKSE